MQLIRDTLSLCPTCYKEIPARILTSNKGVWMEKTCPHHGRTEAMLERDPLFYTWVTGCQSPQIYNGYFLDVTRKCNLRCKFCFYHLEKEDPEGEYSLPALLAEARANRQYAPFIITGGEPTTRPDIATVLTEVSKIGPVQMLSNGTKLADREFFNEIMPLLVANTGVTHLNLSIHHLETDAWKKVIEYCREDGIKIESILIVIETKEDFYKAVQMCGEMRDVAISFRIKAATKLWGEGKPKAEDKIFVSDMLGWLVEHGGELEAIPQNLQTSFMNVLYERMRIMLVSWNDVTNVDLNELSVMPFYRARNGEIRNLVVACLINEGWDKGWCKGRKIIHPINEPTAIDLGAEVRRLGLQGD